MVIFNTEERGKNKWVGIGLAVSLLGMFTYPIWMYCAILFSQNPNALEPTISDWSMFEAIVSGALVSCGTGILWTLLGKIQVRRQTRVSLLLLGLMTIAGFCYGGRLFFLSSALFLFCSSIVLLKIQLSGANEKQAKRTKVALWIIYFEIFLYSIIAVATPGYIFPFLKNPITMMILAFLTLWQFAGAALISTELFLKTPIRFYSSIICFFFFYATPVILSPLMGLAVVSEVILLAR